MIQNWFEHQMDPKSIIKLNVGRQIFLTTIETLTNEKNTLFCTLFSGPFKKEDSNGEYFIDRDPSVFGMILNHLRGMKIPIDLNALTKETLQSLKNEVDYYGISSLQLLIDTFHNRQISVKKYSEEDIQVSYLTPSTIRVKTQSDGTFGLLLEPCKRWGVFFPKGSKTVLVGVADIDFNIYGMHVTQGTSWLVVDDNPAYETPRENPQIHQVSELCRVSRESRKASKELDEANTKVSPSDEQDQDVEDQEEEDQSLASFSGKGSSIEFEYDAGTLRMKIDDEDLGIVATDLPEGLYPAFDIFNSFDEKSDGDEIDAESLPIIIEKFE
jgi:hypothetical protein